MTRTDEARRELLSHGLGPDVVTVTHRDIMAGGFPLEKCGGEGYGKQWGCCIGGGGNDLPATDSVVHASASPCKRFPCLKSLPPSPSIP